MVLGENPLQPGSKEWNRVLEEEVQRQLPGKRQVASVRYAAGRFVVRTLRIASGVALLLGAIWAFSSAAETLDKPFAALSPLELIGGLLKGAGAILLLVWAFGAAFGEGESREMFDARIEGELREHIEQVMTVEPWRLKATGMGRPPQPKLERALVWITLVVFVLAMGFMAWQS